MSDPCREAFEKWAKSVGRSTVRKGDGTYLNRIEDEWRGFQAAWNARAVAEVPSEPTVGQYKEAYDDDCTDEAFGELAWSENDEATSVDHAHAAGFHRGWLTLRTLLIQRQGKCDT